MPFMASYALLRRLLSMAPVTCAVLMSWIAMAVVGIMEWSIYDGFGVVWRVLIIPSYAVLMIGVLAAHVAGPWAVLPTAIVIVAGADFVIYRMRRAGTASLDGRDFPPVGREVLVTTRGGNSGPDASGTTAR
jgi:hypothetical protein